MRVEGEDESMQPCPSGWDWWEVGTDSITSGHITIPDVYSEREENMYSYWSWPLVDQEPLSTEL